MKDYEIVLSESEYEKLIAEIRQLKQDIATLTAEKDDLELHICREILAEYNKKIGNLEYEATQKMLELKQLVRIIEYIQAAINRQEQASYELAKQKTKEEYKKYEDELKKKAEDIKKNAEYARERARQDEKNRQEAERKAQEKAAEEEKKKEENKAEENKEEEKAEDKKEEKTGEKETESEEKKAETPEEELKKLYRKIVKKLHPDMNPDITEAETCLLHEAIEAYGKGDLIRLREIADEIDDEDIAEKYKDNPADIEKLKELRDRLLLQKKDLEYQIKTIKESFPYNAKDFLADEEAVKERQESIRNFLKICDEEIEKLNRKIEEIRKELNKEKNV